jgi:hypothetical protein
MMSDKMCLILKFANNISEKEYLLNDKCFSLQRQVEDLHAQLEASRDALNDAKADKSDLLQLIGVMHASPVAVKTVLEAFLHKLGELRISFLFTESVKFI